MHSCARRDAAQKGLVRRLRSGLFTLVAVVVGLSLLLSTVTARGDAIYSTFGDNFGSNGGFLLAGSVVGGNNLAVPFIAPVTGYVTNITVATGHLFYGDFDLTDGYGQASHVVTLYSDTPNYTSFGGQSGSPGASLFSFASPYGTIQNGSANPYFSFDIAQGPELIAGKHYWIGIRSQGLYEQGEWRLSPNAPAIALEHYVSSGGYWAFTQVLPQPAFSVAMTPEPSSVCVAAFAVAGTLLRRRKA